MIIIRPFKLCFNTTEASPFEAYTNGGWQTFINLEQETAKWLEAEIYINSFVGSNLVQVQNRHVINVTQFMDQSCICGAEIGTIVFRRMAGFRAISQYYSFTRRKNYCGSYERDGVGERERGGEIMRNENIG